MFVLTVFSNKVQKVFVSNSRVELIDRTLPFLKAQFPDVKVLDSEPDDVQFHTFIQRVNNAANDADPATYPLRVSLDSAVEHLLDEADVAEREKGSEDLRQPPLTSDSGQVAPDAVDKRLARAQTETPDTVKPEKSKK